MSALVADRPRAVIRVWGREPVKMLHGLATADIEAVGADRAAYTAFLTVKGRMVADARVLRHPAGETEGELLMDLHPAAVPGLLEHLRKFIPPLFARFEEVSDAWRLIGVYGDGATDVATAAAGGLGPAAGAAGGVVLPENAPEETVVPLATNPPALAVSTRETGGDGWELLVPAASAAAVLEAARGAGGQVGDTGELDRLRVLAGRPRWGAELTDEVIPLEAGLLERAISQGKGCYTGQEVIVRILHRGHVNRHLRRLEFRHDLVDPGTELFEPDNDKPRGVVTSAVAAGEGGVGLGYVRREIDPPAELRAGSPDGPVVRVLEIG